MAPTQPTRWLDDEQQRDWRALVIGTTLLMDQLDDDLRAAFGVSLAEYEILVRLSESEGRAMRMAVLADALRHSRSRVTHTVARMERSGLVVRAACADDGRGIIATMTDKGHALLTRAAPVHVAGVRANLVDLVSPEDFAALGRVMNAVADRLVSGHPDRDIR
ncbi:MarR family winged helix-turn-helix transcriptional regulator [Nocardioides sp.]|uniref:MarR family winged helix-turn-helix transcriptional regulator n=1 Tax=Nocardioides sp. TaxID=35761 RepID=UPI0027342566|nr:MarR family transcriptional regulator [Nocardioides sp.]MDP3890902.1 MarR family transcriptional regulator [Nocardioides sp.]